MHEIILPVLGQSVEEAEIVTWLKKEGDTVSEGDILFTIQTDKAEIECESTAAGVLRKILVVAGIEVPVKTVVALVGEADEALPDLKQYAVKASAPAPVAAAPSSGKASTTQAVQTASAPVRITPPSNVDAAVSPRARKLAGDHHVNAQRLAGSGVGGRVMAEDVQAYLNSLNDLKITPVAKRIASAAGLDVRGITGTGIGEKITREDIEKALIHTEGSTGGIASPPPGVHRAPLSPMRKIVARRMSDSKFSAPHYYVTVEIDMTQCHAFRASLKDFKVSYNDFVLFAVAKALREFPKVNVRWMGDAIDEVEDINLGMAVALDAGLVVPVIRKADTLSLAELCAESKRLAQKALNNALLPDDYQGNTFTVSNLGAFGVDHFTAIINQPDSAIIAVGQMKDRPVVIEGQIVIRPIMKMTISSDHRVIDGAVAARFMGRVKEILESGFFE